MRIYLMLISVMIFSSCVRNKTGQTVEETAAQNVNVFEVDEVIHGGTYTYMKVKENQGERWIATAKTEAESGDVLYYNEALQMSDFQSKELDRTFDEIYFVDKVSKEPMQNNAMGMGQMPMGQMPHDHSHSGKIQTEQKSNIALEKSDDEITIAEIYANPQEYAGEEVELRGVAVKVNKEIMGKNWVHIQDGTNNEGNFDLTVTTTDKVDVNDEVTFKGKITLEKDFGAGYFYDVIMEEAEVLNKTVSKM